MFRRRSCIMLGLLCVLIAPSVSFAQKGTLERGTITIPSLGGETAPFVVYLPPSYTTSEKQYPSFYVLHGLLGSENSLISMRFTMDRMIQDGEIGEMIAVFVNWAITRYQLTYIAEDLVDHVDAQYRTIRDRNSRGITGFSVGGGGSMRLALKYPEMFAVLVAQEGVEYSGEVERYLSLDAIKIVKSGYDVNDEAFDEALAELGVDHEFVTHGRGHVFVPEESLNFLSDHLHPLNEIARLRESAQIAPTTLGATSAGQPTLLEVAVTLDVPPEALEPLQEIFLDLSPLGISSQFPLEHSGEGRYTFSRTITPSRSGRHKLPLIMETAFAWDIEGARYSLLTVDLVVYSAGDEYIYRDELGSGWVVKVSFAEHDPAASDIVHSGSYAHEVVFKHAGGSIEYIFEDPNGFQTFGYTGLGFWINPGTSSTERTILGVATTEESKTVKLGDLGITLAPDMWQKVSIPLEVLELEDTDLKRIWLQAIAGTVYIDDLVLEVAEYGLSEAAATPGRVKPDGKMPVLLTVQATPSVLEPGDPPTTVTVDLTPIGGAPDAVMVDDGTGGDRVVGDGIYTLRTTVDPEIRNGRKDLVITSTDRHLRAIRTHLEVGVVPAEDVYLYRDAVEEGWDLGLFKAEVDPTSTDYVQEGSHAQALTLEPTGQVEYIVEDPDGLTTFGYATLAFWIHPGDAAIEELKVIASRREGRISKLKVLSLVEELGVSFGSESWQLVSIPMDALELGDARLEYIQLSGAVEGTFYIDNLRFVPEEVLEPVEPTAVEVADGEVVPSVYSLSQNYPNPFNPETTIRYDLPEAGTVRLSVYNMVGQMVRMLVDGERPDGSYSVMWDGRDDTGRDVASGVYLYCLEVEGQYMQTRRMVLLR